MQNSEFAYFSSESGKHMKPMSNPPFGGNVGVKKWSPFLDAPENAKSAHTLLKKKIHFKNTCSRI